MNKVKLELYLNDGVEVEDVITYLNCEALCAMEEDEEFISHWKWIVNEEDQVTIRWSYEDVKALRPDFSDEKALEILDKCARSLKDRSTEEGWLILDTLIDIYEKENA